MSRLAFWVFIGLFCAFLLAGFVGSEWQRLTSPDDPLQREFWLVEAILFGVLPAYFLARAVFAVLDELRRRRATPNRD